MQKTIVWFRQDLRIQDNPALSFAAQQGGILPIYIDDDQNAGSYAPGGAAQWWLHHSLQQLDQQLSGNLKCFRGDPLAILQMILAETDANQVVWNRCYEPWQIKRDSEIKKALVEQGTQLQSFNGSLLWEPWQVLKKDQTPYKVFTPFYRKGCLAVEPPRMPSAAVENTDYLAYQHESVIAPEALFPLPNINWYAQFSQHFQPGHAGAADKLASFLKHAAIYYKDMRNLPATRGTSQLSPHLHFGEISPHQVWYAAIDAFNGHWSDTHLDCYLSELGWREFSYYLLYHFPSLPEQNFNAKFDNFPWRQDEQALHAWQTGQTGIPIVDAGMRELWQTGYMHNRVRMIVGSFLVKNLLLDWRAGERWFWDCLLDADLASNSASWQWVAGSGADAAPYFRIFNPILQGEKFDKAGQYVRRYCPELSKLPDKFIHQPWQAPENILQACGVKLGVDYPKPIVDLKASRQRALDAFATTKESGQ